MGRIDWVGIAEREAAILSPVMNRVVFNGREYSSVEEMPPDVRRVYEDAMASVAALDKAGGSGGPHIRITTRLVVNGKEYSNVHEMPPLIRTAFEKLAHRIAKACKIQIRLPSSSIARLTPQART